MVSHEQDRTVQTGHRSKTAHHSRTVQVPCSRHFFPSPLLTRSKREEDCGQETGETRGLEVRENKTRGKKTVDRKQARRWGITAP